MGGDNTTIYPLDVHYREGSDRVLPSPDAASYRPFRQWFPWLVPAFVVANVAVFIATMYVNNCPGNGGSGASKCVLRSVLGRFSFEPFKENPLLGPSSATLLKMGALEAMRVVHEQQSWRLITCIWLHAGVIHIFANMLSLLLIGIRLEQEFGFVRIGILYIISGLGGTLLSALSMQSSISVGASGALFGLLGSMLSELITNWTIYENKFAALLTLVVIIAINLAVGILPHVDNFAHVGGFITGFLLGFMILIRPQFGWISQRNAPLGYFTGSTKQKYKIYQYILWVLAAISLALWFTLGFYLLFKGVNAIKHCPWCHYLRCIPTSKWSCKTQTRPCITSQNGDQLKLTCQDSGRFQMLWLSNTTETVYELCLKLCSS
ncbi:RHOMBOID-like protein 2 [Typha angustifolia]|uniref:RHOMBOID-like protein 2 n=1 Tax=Typha angustifolia TaxID=59011 RepID=UPI003C2CF4C7